MPYGLFQITTATADGYRSMGMVAALLWASLASIAWGLIPVPWSAQAQIPVPEASQNRERFGGWIDSAPPGIKRLIDLGRVTFETSDAELAARKKQGLTIFRFDYRYRYRFSNSASRKSGDSSTIVSAKISVTEILLSHRIVVGSGFEPESPWRSRLLQHEFDHVSISTDPRLRVLLKQVLGAPMTLELANETPAIESATPLEQRIDSKVAALMKERVQEIERVTQAFNDHFDRESNSGVRAIQTREEFFGDFFTADSLVKLNFKFPETLDVFSKSIAKSDWKEHYLLNTPP